MRIYFYDENMRYIGSRELVDGESIPANATTKSVEVSDGQEAYLVDGEWVVCEILIDSF